MTNTYHVNLSRWHFKPPLEIETESRIWLYFCAFLMSVGKNGNVWFCRIKDFTQLLILLESNSHCTRVWLCQISQSYLGGWDKSRVRTKTKISFWFSLEMGKSDLPMNLNICFPGIYNYVTYIILYKEKKSFSLNLAVNVSHYFHTFRSFFPFLCLLPSQRRTWPFWVLFTACKWKYFFDCVSDI